MNIAPIGKSTDQLLILLPQMANRHGLITGARIGLPKFSSYLLGCLG